jgi:hypothetical protein
LSGIANLGTAATEFASRVDELDCVDRVGALVALVSPSVLQSVHFLGDLVQTNEELPRLLTS